MRETHRLKLSDERGEAATAPGACRTLGTDKAEIALACGLDLFVWVPVDGRLVQLCKAGLLEAASVLVEVVNGGGLSLCVGGKDPAVGLVGGGVVYGAEGAVLMEGALALDGDVIAAASADDVCGIAGANDVAHGRGV